MAKAFLRSPSAITLHRETSLENLSVSSARRHFRIRPRMRRSNKRPLLFMEFQSGHLSWKRWWIHWASIWLPCVSGRKGIRNRVIAIKKHRKQRGLRASKLRRRTPDLRIHSGLRWSESNIMRRTSLFSSLCTSEQMHHEQSLPASTSVVHFL